MVWEMNKSARTSSWVSNRGSAGVRGLLSIPALAPDQERTGDETTPWPAPDADGWAATFAQPLAAKRGADEEGPADDEDEEEFDDDGLEDGDEEDEDVEGDEFEDDEESEFDGDEDEEDFDDEFDDDEEEDDDL